LICIVRNYTDVKMRSVRTRRVLVQDHFAGLLASATGPTRFVEKTLACFLLLCVNLSTAGDLADQIVRSMAVVTRLEPATFASLADIVARGVECLLDRSASRVRYVLARITFDFFLENKLFVCV
jgi:hypothetical protein